MTGTSTWPVVIAVGAVVCAFTAATAYSTYRSRNIEASAIEISEQLSPRIERMAESRLELRQISLLLKSDVRTEIEENWLRADDKLWSYLNGITTWDEPRTELVAHLRALEREFERFFQSQNLDSMALRESLQRVSDLTLACLESDAAQARELAERIERAHRRADHIAFSLDGVSAVLAILAAVLLRRYLHRQAEVLAAHAQLSEQRAQELQYFAECVAHDIASPMMAAVIALDRVGRVAPDETTQRVVARGRSGLDRATQIVRDILSFARSGAHPDPKDRTEASHILEQIVDETRIQAAAAHVDLYLKEAPHCEVACNPGILASITENLVRNAIKYTSGSAPAQVEIRATADARMLHLEVEDTGPGILPGSEDQIFEAYVRGANQYQPGLGIGLATVKKLALAHRGRVGVRAAQDRGSIFWVELPLTERGRDLAVT